MNWIVGLAIAAIVASGCAATSEVDVDRAVVATSNAPVFEATTVPEAAVLAAEQQVPVAEAAEAAEAVEVEVEVEADLTPAADPPADEATSPADAPIEEDDDETDETDGEAVALPVDDPTVEDNDVDDPIVDDNNVEDNDVEPAPPADPPTSDDGDAVGVNDPVDEVEDEDQGREPVDDGNNEPADLDQPEDPEEADETQEPVVPPRDLSNVTVVPQPGVTVHEMLPPANLHIEFDDPNVVVERVTVTCSQVGESTIIIREAGTGGILGTSCREAGRVAYDEDTPDYRWRYQFHFQSQTPWESVVEVRIESRMNVADDGDSESNPRALDLGVSSKHHDQVSASYDPVDSLVLVPADGDKGAQTLRFDCTSAEQAVVLVQVFSDQKLTIEEKTACAEAGSVIATPVDTSNGAEIQLVVTAIDGGGASWSWTRTG